MEGVGLRFRRKVWAVCTDFYEFMLKICAPSVTMHDDYW